MSLGYQDVRDADAFEEPAVFVEDTWDLSHQVSATLVKIKMLLDLRALQTSKIVGGRVPQELLDEIRANLVSDIVSRNERFVAGCDLSNLIQELQGHVEILFKAVDQANKHFWPAIVNPGSHLDAQPGAFSLGTKEQMQIVLGFCYDSWAETPGAVDEIRRLRWS